MSTVNIDSFSLAIYRPCRAVVDRIVFIDSCGPGEEVDAAYTSLLSAVVHTGTSVIEVHQRVFMDVFGIWIFFALTTLTLAVVTAPPAVSITLAALWTTTAAMMDGCESFKEFKKAQIVIL